MTLVSTGVSAGAYTFTLHAPVDQPIGGEDSIAINLNGRVTVTDFGGPAADMNVRFNASITVIDDTPDAVVASITAAPLVLDESPLVRPPATALPRRPDAVTRTSPVNFAAADFRRRRAGSVSYALALTSDVQSATLSLSAFGPSVGSWTGQDRCPRELADVNGDGKADIVGFGDSPASMSLCDRRRALCRPHIRACCLRSGRRRVEQRRHLSARACGRERGRTADIVGFGIAGIYVSLATGDGHFAAPTYELAAFGAAAGGWSSHDIYPRELADVNGDGKADIVGFGLAGVYVSLPPEAGTLPPPHTSLLPSVRPPEVEHPRCLSARACGRERGRDGRHRRVRPSRSSMSLSPPEAGTLPPPHTSLLPSVRPPEGGAATTLIHASLRTSTGTGGPTSSGSAKPECMSLSPPEAGTLPPPHTSLLPSVQPPEGGAARINLRASWPISRRSRRGHCCLRF